MSSFTGIKYEVWEREEVDKMLRERKERTRERAKAI